MNLVTFLWKMMRWINAKNAMEVAKSIIMTYEEPGIYAVRWARRELKRLFMLDYTRWHISTAANPDWTLCGRMIGVGLEGTLLPEVDGCLERVDCIICRKVLKAQEINR